MGDEVFDGGRKANECERVEVWGAQARFGGRGGPKFGILCQPSHRIDACFFSWSTRLNFRFAFAFFIHSFPQDPRSPPTFPHFPRSACHFAVCIHSGSAPPRDRRKSQKKSHDVTNRANEARSAIALAHIQTVLAESPSQPQLCQSRLRRGSLLSRCLGISAMVFLYVSHFFFDLVLPMLLACLGLIQLTFTTNISLLSFFLIDVYGHLFSWHTCVLTFTFFVTGAGLVGARNALVSGKDQQTTFFLPQETDQSLRIANTSTSLFALFSPTSQPKDLSNIAPRHWLNIF